MKLILAEKPSVAEDIAKALGGGVKEKDHIKVRQYIITWAYGHLLEIDDRIAPEKWELESLPIFPQRFEYVVTNPHFYNIKKLLQKAEEVIIATDAGREGELIARLILLKAGWNKWDKTYRFWTSQALTPEVVRKVLNNLRHAKEFDSLFWSALARQHADWIVGINMTRLATLLAGNVGVWSIGRVQTPTLTLIVQRTQERENFNPQPYYVIKAKFEKDGKTIDANLLVDSKALINSETEEDREENNEDRAFRLSEEKAKQILKRLEEEQFGEVVFTKRVKRTQPPPRLYSLTSLQRKANEVFGWSASKTLDILQRLYEKHKCVSYPRTDAEYLSEANKGLVKEVLKKLSADSLISRVDTVGKRVFDDSKLTDHHAIIPLDVLPKIANKEEEMLYDLIKRRFLAVFMPDYVYLNYEVVIRLGEYKFIATGKKILELGWKKIEGGEDEEFDLSFVKKGDKLRKISCQSIKRWTKPPDAYTEGLLLKKMEKLNLGTPATRSTIIETLKKRGFIVSNRKHLIATEKAKVLVKFLEGSSLLDYNLTSLWERKLEEIYTKRLGKKGYEAFLEDIKNLIRVEVEKLSLRKIEVRRRTPFYCP